MQHKQRSASTLLGVCVRQTRLGRLERLQAHEARDLEAEAVSESQPRFQQKEPNSTGLI